LDHELTEIKAVPISTKMVSHLVIIKSQQQERQCIDKVQAEKKQAGRFIIATNELDIEALSSENLLHIYKKEQRRAEF